MTKQKCYISDIKNKKLKKTELNGKVGNIPNLCQKKKVRIFTIWLLKRIRKTTQKKNGNRTFNNGFR